MTITMEHEQYKQLKEHIAELQRECEVLKSGKMGIVCQGGAYKELTMISESEAFKELVNYFVETQNRLLRIIKILESEVVKQKNKKWWRLI